MSFRVIGYLDGHRITVDDGPSRGRLSSGGIGGTAIAGGFAQSYVIEARGRPPKLVTPSLRGEALIERKRK